MAMIIIPTRIQTMQKIRAKNDLGARSPYLNNKGMFFFVCFWLIIFR